MMQGVISPTKAALNRQRFRSPQYQLEDFIKLPSFDRGRRKISKMGGVQINYSGVKPKPAGLSPNIISRKEKSRRFTSTSPNPSNKLVSKFVKMNTMNLSHNKNNDIAQVRSIFILYRKEEVNPDIYSKSFLKSTTARSSLFATSPLAFPKRYLILNYFYRWFRSSHKRKSKLL